MSRTKRIYNSWKRWGRFMDGTYNWNQLSDYMYHRNLCMGNCPLCKDKKKPLREKTKKHIQLWEEKSQSKWI